VSDQREQLVRDIFGRWNAGERELDPEEIDPGVAVFSVMTGDTYRHLEGVRQWMAEIDEQFEDWDLTVGEVRSVSDERLLVLGEIHFRGRSSGVEFDQAMGWLVDFDGDRVSALHNIVGHDAAIEAAGLTANS
jgi:hypothetical protein